MNPLTSGEYPLSMRKQVGSRLPVFTPEQRALLVGSLDFVAINYYFPYMTSPGTYTSEDTPSYFKDMNITTTFNSSWPLSQTGWGIYGPGLRDLLMYSSKRYPEVPLYVTENGLAWEEPTVADAVNDTMRQQYLHDHIEAVGQALEKGCDIRGYFVWSFQVRRRCALCLYLWICMLLWSNSLECLVDLCL